MTLMTLSIIKQKREKYSEKPEIEYKEEKICRILQL